MTKTEAIRYLKQLYPNGGHCWLDEQRIEAIGMAIDGLTEGYVQHPWSIIRIIEGALAGDIDKVIRYSRRLADTYIKDDDQKFADCILSVIGDKEVPMSTMDDDQRTNEGIDKFTVDDLRLLRNLMDTKRIDTGLFDDEDYEVVLENFRKKYKGGIGMRNDDEKKLKVITLCGSTRFKEQFLEVQKRLTLEGNVVISVGLFGHSGDEEVWKPGMKEMLDKMHLQKIDMADEIFVINVGGYIGESTRREIAYATDKGKKVNYLEKTNSNDNI